jgi:hypothetical protein
MDWGDHRAQKTKYEPHSHQSKREAKGEKCKFLTHSPRVNLTSGPILSCLYNSVFVKHCPCDTSSIFQEINCWLLWRKQQATQPGHKIQPPAGSGSSTRTSAKVSPVAVKPKSKSHKSRRKVSLLEGLPTEILQRIFLFCINLELPRTSFILRDKLSTEIVYLRTLYEGFGPSWSDLRPHVWPKEESFYYDTRKGNHVLQVSHEITQSLHDMLTGYHPVCYSKM